jgi:hypothetical protein
LIFDKKNNKNQPASVNVIKEKARDKAISDYYDTAVSHTIRANYMLHLNIVNSSETIYNSNSNNRRGQLELETTIRLETLDTQVNWTLDTCWFDDIILPNVFTFFTSVYNVMDELEEFNKYEEEDGDEYDDDEQEDYESIPREIIFSQMSGTIRRERRRVKRQPTKANTITFNITNSEAEFSQNNNGFYFYSMKNRLVFSNLSDLLTRKKYLLCNLKPVCSFLLLQATTKKKQDESQSFLIYKNLVSFCRCSLT